MRVAERLLPSYIRPNATILTIAGAVQLLPVRALDTDLIFCSYGDCRHATALHVYPDPSIYTETLL